MSWMRGWQSGFVAICLSVFCLIGIANPAFADTVQHPMDALTAAEYETTLNILKEQGFVDETSRYPFIRLQPPAKETVLAWQPGQPFDRAAFAMVKQGPEVYEAEVNLTQQQVTRWEAIADVQAGILLEEWTHAQEITQADTQWQAAVKKRGITAVDYEKVVCAPLSAGYYGLPEEAGRRLFKVNCYDQRDTENFWGRPIEGVTAVVDIDAEEVIKLIDTGVVPMPTSPAGYTEAEVTQNPAPKPLDWVEAKGHDYSLDGQVVNWNNWQFHVRMDSRVGLVLSLVKYQDQGNWRSVMYEGSLSELFVPYQSTDPNWYFRTYMDAGEYGAGKLTVPLEHDRDCPSTAVYLDAVFTDDRGQPYVQEDAACIFERYAGDPVWRHYNFANDQSTSRRDRELVVRFITVIGNYDYVFDWSFGENGTLKVKVGASGMEEVQAVPAMRFDTEDGTGVGFGRMVAPQTMATNHDHFFSFRLDMDVDGAKNSFVCDDLKTIAVKESPRTSLWAIASHMPKTELDAKMTLNLREPSLWRVINPHVENFVGYPTSYEFKAHGNAMSLMQSDDYPQQRAGFTQYHLWVTPYEPDELYAAGNYPNQSHGGDGLPAWTRQNRSIQDTDIVVWYTLGLHHVVRAEDWPVLPTEWHEFEVRPFDFFDRNPALEISSRA
ncbi:MAG: primary-amine oxidase [Leptolyngbya sp. SIO1D8]|nr:primary-amine oxidase [Leptolyngbya sp. SIO1D8]